MFWNIMLEVYFPITELQAIILNWWNKRTAFYESRFTGQSYRQICVGEAKGDVAGGDIYKPTYNYTYNAGQQ